MASTRPGRLSRHRHDAHSAACRSPGHCRPRPLSRRTASWFTERDAIKRIIADRIALSTIDELLAILEPADIWCAKVLDWQELIGSDGFKVLDMLQTVTRPDHVSIETTASPLRIDGRRPHQHRAAPLIGEHNDTIIREFGL